MRKGFNKTKQILLYFVSFVCVHSPTPPHRSQRRLNCIFTANINVS